MRKQRTHIGRVLAAAVALAMLAGGGAAGGSDRPWPYRLTVRPAWGQPTGPASFLGELERALVVELTTAGCYRSIGTAAPAAPAAEDLLLRVTVHGYEEELECEFGISDREAELIDPQQRLLLGCHRRETVEGV